MSHEVRVGAVPEVHLVSAGCTCGWVLVEGFETEAGELAARRLVARQGDRHVRVGEGLT